MPFARADRLRYWSLLPAFWIVSVPLAVVGVRSDTPWLFIAAAAIHLAPAFLVKWWADRCLVNWGRTPEGAERAYRNAQSTERSEVPE